MTMSDPLQRLSDSLRLYGRYFLIHMKSIMQYKTSFFLTCLGQFFTSFNVFLGIYFMFRRFHTVKGYTYQEVLLCYSIVLMAFTLAEAFARLDTILGCCGPPVCSTSGLPAGCGFADLSHRWQDTARKRVKLSGPLTIGGTAAQTLRPPYMASARRSASSAGLAS